MEVSSCYLFILFQVKTERFKWQQENSIRPMCELSEEQEIYINNDYTNLMSWTEIDESTNKKKEDEKWK